jgi:hypothetical protein
MVAKVAACRL